MTSQLEERTTTHVPLRGPDRNESPAQRGPKKGRKAVAAAAAVAAVAGLVVAVARFDRAPAPANGPEPAVASSSGVNTNGLPEHLQQIEALVEASEEPQRPAYAIIQDYIDAASAEEPQRPAYAIIQDYIDAASAEEPQRPAYAIIQDYIDAASAEEPQRPAYAIIQDYIDAASAEEPPRPAGAS